MIGRIVVELKRHVPTRWRVVGLHAGLRQDVRDLVVDGVREGRRAAPFHLPNMVGVDHLPNVAGTTCWWRPTSRPEGSTCARCSK